MHQTSLLSDRKPSAIVWIGSTQGFFLVITSVFACALSDRGHLQPVLLVGFALMMVGITGLTYATTFAEVMIFQGVFLGMGGGSVWAGPLTLLTRSFEEKWAIPTAAAVSGGSIGSRDTGPSRANAGFWLTG